VRLKNRDVQLIKVRGGVHVPEGEPKSNRVWQGLLYTGAVFFFLNGGIFLCVLICGEGTYLGEHVEAV
jgi:hypothetical protein